MATPTISILGWTIPSIPSRPSNYINLFPQKITVNSNPSLFETTSQTINILEAGTYKLAITTTSEFDLTNVYDPPTIFVSCGELYQPPLFVLEIPIQGIPTIGTTIRVSTLSTFEIFTLNESFNNFAVAAKSSREFLLTDWSITLTKLV